ncbi:unnamed protein product [Protopolystoma xenopodis]|uniref:Uncharacterized protein n=1 Tax=Protopolystoma xenopodis TaxID=117903 RepID=A0A448WI12_9PLAT|nr:unnamed protein product [Protopolystoma xenopodis]
MSTAAARMLTGLPWAGSAIGPSVDLSVSQSVCLAVGQSGSVDTRGRPFDCQPVTRAGSRRPLSVSAPSRLPQCARALRHQLHVAG